MYAIPFVKKTYKVYFIHIITLLQQYSIAVESLVEAWTSQEMNETIEDFVLAYFLPNKNKQTCNIF